MRVQRMLALAALAAEGWGIAHGAELRPVAVAAWNTYAQAADSQMRARIASGGPFLWVDQTPGRDLQVRTGEILIAPGRANGTQTVPDGLMHHWVAAAFIPGVKLASVLRVVHNYGNYKEFYNPAIVESKLMSSTSGEENFSMRSLHKVLFITAVLDSQFVARDFPVDASRWYVIAESARLQEVENYGRPNERVLPPDHGRGFLWRLHTITRYEERDGGVYIEMEAIALSRDIPATVRWMFTPAIDRFSRGEMVSCLRRTREAVSAAATAEERLTYSAARQSAGARDPADRK